MANHSSWHQDRFFYGNKWPKSVTVYLVDQLVYEKENGNWDWDAQNTSAIANAHERINAFFDLNFDLVKVHHRVRWLKNRVASFKHVINHNGVYWDDDNNIVHASPIMWEHLEHHNPLAKAYMYQGEPLYGQLKLLYSDPTDEHVVEDRDEANEVHAPKLEDSSSITPPAPNRCPNTSNPVILNFYDEDSDDSTCT